MPTIFFYGPQISDDDRKRELIADFTESAVTVYLRASSPDIVGVGGELLRDRQQKLKREHREENQ